MEKTVVELFAGVGGFRVGLNEVKLDNGKTIEKNNFKFVWANQWEPSTKVQHAFDCYEKRFGKSPNHSNVDIAKVNKKEIPDHTLLVGGFPCQDYSVARSLSGEKGINGKKGVLWWQIYEILKVKRPPFVLLENVDRLIKSPSISRGRDFGIMLRSLFDLGYDAEWRVINAADYGHPQRRRRVFIFAFKRDTNYSLSLNNYNELDVINEFGIFAKQFPIEKLETLHTSVLSNFKDLVDVTDNYEFKFENSGYFKNGIVYTNKSIPIFQQPKLLSNIIIRDNVDDYFILSKEKIDKFRNLRGRKKIERKKNGIVYFYSEGSMSEFDSLDLPGRTMLTSEGTVNRSTHIILDPISNKKRTLTPVECERLNEFPDNWTDTGMTINKRRFMMGNALVCGVIRKLGSELNIIFNKEEV